MSHLKYNYYNSSSLLPRSDSECKKLFRENIAKISKFTLTRVDITIPNKIIA